MKETIISGRGLTKTFGENTVLHGIDIDIYAGDFTVIMGPSGSGKSTLLYALSGMDRVSGGQLLYRDRDISNATEKELTKLRAEQFGLPGSWSCCVPTIRILASSTVWTTARIWTRS